MPTANSPRQPDAAAIREALQALLALIADEVARRLTVQFDDVAVSDFFDEMVDRGLPPERFGRVWIHTHPGDSASPSCVDEETFVRSFGRSDWAIMSYSVHADH